MEKCPECGRKLMKGGKCYFCGSKIKGPGISLLFYAAGCAFFFNWFFAAARDEFSLFDISAVAAVALTGIILFLYFIKWKKQ